MNIRIIKKTFSNLALAVLILAITLGVIPPSTMETLAAEEAPPIVTEIKVIKKFYSIETPSIYLLTIRGSNLLSAKVTYEDSGGEIRSIGQPVEASSNNLVQYEINPEYIGQNINIGDKEYYIGEDNIPMLQGIDPRSVKKNTVDGLTIKGARFNNIDIDDSDNITIRAFYYQGIHDIEISQDIIDSGSDSVALTVDNFEGLQNIRFDREDTSGTVPITISYRYLDIFRIYNDLDISDSDQITMYPNRGETGSRVYFKAENLKTDMSVFFLEKYDGTEKFTQANKGINPTYESDVEDGYDQFTVTIPDTLEIGKEYFVVFTNKVEDDMDPERIITQEKLLGEEKSDKFTVISKGDGVQVFEVDPVQGPDTGQSVMIEGKYFGTININELTDYNTTPAMDEDDEQEIVFNYGNGKYLDIPVVDIQKTVKVFIASNATFEDGKNELVNFKPNRDVIYIKTPSLSLTDEELRENIIITTITTFKEEGAGGVQYRFEEREEYDGFTFIPSRIQPVIEKISPSKIMVRENPIGDGTYVTTDDIYLAIHGENFLIHKFNDTSDTELTRYPVIDIGGELIINKNDGLISDKNGPLPEEVDLIVLNDEGRILDGSTYNEIGSKIIVKIPEGKVIPGEIVSRDHFIHDITLTVTNPIRNNTGPGANDKDYVAFMEVSEDNAPQISSVEPNVVTLGGGKSITIDGSNFYEGVHVYIDGDEVNPITRSGDGKKITFIAPPGREGRTQLLVLNEDGGIATHDFWYVKTYTKPEVENIAPGSGMANTLVIIEGDNFLPPDPTGTVQNVMGINRLIGTRVIFRRYSNEEDLNRYYYEDGEIALQTYVAPTDDYKLIKMDSANGDITLADHYYSVVLQQEDPANPGTGSLIDNFYTLTVKEGEDPVLTDGVNDTYSVVSRDSGTGYELKVKKEGEDPIPLTVSNSTIEFDGKILYVRTFYEILENESGDDVITGNRVRVKDKTQIYIKIPILGYEGEYDVIVRNPDIMEVVTEDGFYFYAKPTKKPEIYDISPSEGSVFGGRDIEITGINFERLEKSPTEIIQSKVWIDGQEVPPEDIIVAPDGEKITLTVPPYPLDKKEELGLDRITVPVMIVNPGGGSDSVENGFTYVNPTSHPEIYRLFKVDRGGVYETYLQIYGKDFRYFEPFEDENGNAEYDSDIGLGIDENFFDVNNNTQYDDFRSSIPTTPYKAAVELLEARSEDSTDEALIQQTITDEILPVLPEVKIGKNVVEIVEYMENYLLVRIPADLNEDSDVYLVNNDHGVSNKMTYDYVPIIPKIDRIDPLLGNKTGRTYMEVIGRNFVETRFDVYELDATNMMVMSQKEFTMVRFDDISKTEHIIGSMITEVMLDGGLLVTYNGNNHNVTVNIKERVAGVDKEYERVFDFTSTEDKVTRYIEVGVLQDTSEPTEFYDGYELIKITIDKKNLSMEVERGYSPSTKLIRAGQLQVWTPSYYTISPDGVTITVINANGYTATASQRFEYTNPIVDVTMTDIVDVIEKKRVIEGSLEYDIIESTADIGITFTVKGTGFMKPLKVKIGGQEADILPNGISDNQIRVRAKALTDPSMLNKPLLIAVEVEDVGSATSADPTLTVPIYYVYREKGGSSPEIYEIIPNTYSVEGGSVVTIKGKNFAVNNGLDNVIVKIGDNVAEVRSGSTINQLLVTLPESDVIGPVDVYVKNIEPLGETVLKNGFIYCSNPTITDLDPEKVHTTGGEKLIIEGAMFMEGVDVTINDKPVQKVTRIDSNTIEIITPPIEEDGIYTLRVINSDGGFATTSISYVLPYPDIPSGLRIYPGNERSFVIKWDEADGADRYKIYARKNGSSNDYKFLGETKGTEYHIKDLEPNTYYYFKVWAVNKYGSSLGYATGTGRTLTSTQDKGDDKYEEKVEMEQIVNYAEEKVTVVFPDYYTEEEFTLDLRGSKYKDAEEIQVSVPLSVARRVWGTITIRTALVEGEISLYNLSNSVWYKGDDLEDNNIILKITKVSDAEKARITKYLSRKEDALTDAYNLEIIYQRKKEMESLTLKSGMEFRLLIDQGDYIEDNLSIYRYSPEKNSLVEQTSTVKTYYDYELHKYVHSVTAFAKDSGKYILIYKK